MQILKHVNYNFLFSTMEKPFLTGLRFKNSLTNQLVVPDLCSKSLSPATAEMSSGILVDPLYTPIVTWDMPGSSLLIEELHL